MPPQAERSRSIPRLPLIVGGAAVIAVLAALLDFNKPTTRPAESSATPEAKAYLANLQLSDVTMKASENFMQQQVIEIEGSLGNKGPRPLQSVDVYCLFYGIDGREIYRERVPVISSKSAPLKPGEARHFRLPFDSIPSGWNQVLPRMVIAQITFDR